jgi:O-antigen/teichoic acid export membrane protein
MKSKAIDHNRRALHAADVALPCKDKLFDTEHLKADLKGRSVRGGAVTFVGQGAKFILQLGSTMVLARLLTPQDFGLIAMIAVIIGLASMFKDLGLSMATVQRAEINDQQVSTLFWVNVAMSLLCMAVTMVLSPGIAWLYKEPRLLWITIVLASAFVFGGLTVQHQALLRRQMRFLSLVRIDIISMFAGVVTGIVCGLAGLGYWSLVLMQLATPITMAAGVWIASGWRPGLPVRRSGVRSMLAFGGYQTLANMVSFSTRNVDKVLLGFCCGSYLTGLYSKAFSLLLLPAQQIATPMMSVAVPTLSRLQNDPKRYREYYLRAIKTLSYATMPLIALMGALSTQIVLLLLGDQWIRAAFIFRILAFASLWLPVSQTAIWVYLSLGQTRRMAAWFSMACPITIVALIIGLPWGPEGVAIAYTIITWLLVYPLFAFCLKLTPVKLGNVFSAIWRPFVLSSLVYVTMTAAQVCLQEVGATVALLGALSAGVGIMFAGAAVSPPFRADIQDLVNMLKMACFRTTASVTGRIG